MSAPPKALDYLKSFGLDPWHMSEDGWDRWGYRVPVRDLNFLFEDDFRPWPKGFDYEKFLLLMAPEVIRRARRDEEWSTEERFRNLEERVAKLEELIPC